MNPHAKQTGRQEPRSRFLIWGWAMLLVVLLSATPTGGQVRSRIIGSAFDPATFSVAVNPRAPKSKVLVKATVNRPPAALADGPVFHAGAAILQSPPLMRVDRALPAEPLPGRVVNAGPGPKAHGARAPPAG